MMYFDAVTSEVSVTIRSVYCVGLHSVVMSDNPITFLNSNDMAPCHFPIQD